MRTSYYLFLIVFQAVREQCFSGPGDRPDAKNVAIVITDGFPFPFERYQPAIDEAEKLRMEYSKNLDHPYEINQYYSIVHTILYFL